MPFESTPLETEPTVPSGSSGNFQLSFQMMVDTIFIILGVPSNILAIIFLWRKCDGSLASAAPLLLNLAGADLLVLTVFVPFHIVYEATGFEWPFGSLLCKGVFSLTHVCMYASLATLATIAVERYLITFYYPIRKKLVKYAICVIWIVALILSIPQFVFLKTINVNSFEASGENELLNGEGEGEDGWEDKYVCDIVWPHPNIEKILQPIDAVIMYLVPLAFVFVIYAKIIFKLRAIDRKQLQPARLCFVKQRKRAIRKMIAFIVIFAMGHLPIHIFHLLRVFFFETWEVLVTVYPWLFTLCANLVLATHVMNPLVYGSLHHCFMFCNAFLKYLDCHLLSNSPKGFSRSLLIRRSNTKQTVKS